ncbi:MAG: YncE family protein [Chloroflexi bacterium]|nr:YncE family protein [Chloroflexota bacterium]
MDSKLVSQVQRIIWTGFVLLLALGVMCVLVWQVLPTAAQPGPEWQSPAAAEADNAYPAPVDIAPDAQAGFGRPEEMVTHTAVLQNNTGVDHSFTLSLAPGYTWDASVSPMQTAVLTPGAYLPITVTVLIPPGIGEGQMDSLTVLAQPDATTQYTGTAVIDTAVICDPYLAFRGESRLDLNVLDDTYAYAGQRAAYLLIDADVQPTYFPLNAIISGYDPDSDTWQVIAEQTSGPGGLLVHQTLMPPTYSKIRVQMDERSSYNGYVSYEYQIAVCREPAVYLEPAVQDGYVGAGETAVYSQTLTNWTMDSATFDLSAAGNAWPVSFWHNGSQITRTTLLADLETFAFEVHATTPPGASPGADDVVTIQATAVTSPTINNSATLTTHVTGELAYITLSGANQVAVVDTANAAFLHTIDVGGSSCTYPQRAAMNPSGSSVYVACVYSNNVAIIDTATQTVSHVIGSIYSPNDITFSRDGQYAFISKGYSYEVVVVNTTNFFQLVIPINSVAYNLVSHPFLDLIYISTDNNEILVLDAATFTVVNSIDLEAHPRDMAIAPDGQWLYVGDDWGRVCLWWI